MKKKIDRLGILRNTYAQRPTISLMKVGAEVLSDSPTVQSITKAHDNMTTALAVVGFGLVGLFAIRSFTK